MSSEYNWDNSAWSDKMEARRKVMEAMRKVMEAMRKVMEAMRKVMESHVKTAVVDVRQLLTHPQQHWAGRGECATCVTRCQEGGGYGGAPAHAAQGKPPLIPRPTEETVAAVVGSKLWLSTRKDLVPKMGRRRRRSGEEVIGSAVATDAEREELSPRSSRSSQQTQPFGHFLALATAKSCLNVLFINKETTS